MQFKVSWSDLKAFVSDRNLSIQWISNKNLYWLVAIDGAMEMVAQISISTPTIPGSDQEDFENNFKSGGNQSPRGSVVQVLGKDSLSLYPFGAINTLTAGVVNTWDIEIPFTAVLRGGSLFSQNATMGDYINILIIDKNNITQQGGTPDDPTILGTYVKTWYIMPGIENRVEDISISEFLYQGLFIRILYTSVGSINPQIIINFISYQTISD